MEDVKRALRALSLKHHPDRVAPGRRANAERKMKEISAAYHWLLSHADGQEVAA